jgi:hypothetical protein
MNCEICGKPATKAVSGLKDVPPSGESRQWELDGEPHFLCADHAGESIHRALPPDWRLKMAHS